MSEIPPPYLPQTSGTYHFRPEFADWIVESFERLGIGPAALDDPRYIISARRSANLICLDLGANRGANLWAIGDETLNIPLSLGQDFYLLPSNTVTLLDCYLRQYTPDVNNWRSLGNPLTAVIANGQPVLTHFGEPAVLAPNSGVITTTQDTQYVTMHWPAHGFAPGSPVFFGYPVTIGPQSLRNFVIVAEVLDADNFTFVAPHALKASRAGVGGVPLFTTVAGSSAVTVSLSFHGYSVGDWFPVPVQTVIGGVSLLGWYTVNNVVDFHNFQIATLPQVGITNSYWQFSVAPLPTGPHEALPAQGSFPAATANGVAFINGGRLMVTGQAPGVHMPDLMLMPVSRNDYSMMPDKLTQGRPSIYWFDRTDKKRIYVWATPQASGLYGFIAYRMRYLEDVEMDAAVDMPRRFLPAFTAQLTAALSEKFKPEVFQEKLQLAEIMWERAANADVEHVSSYIIPQLQSYFR